MVCDRNPAAWDTPESPVSSVKRIAARRFLQFFRGAERTSPEDLLHAARRFPVFPAFGRGDYKVQPIYAGDLAAQAVASGSLSENTVAVAAGPDTFTFEELLRLLAKAVNTRVRLGHMLPAVGFAATRLIGPLLRDVVLTRDEVDGLMAGLLTSHAAPAGTTRLAGWLEDNPDILGQQYVCELRRNCRR